MGGRKQKIAKISSSNQNPMNLASLLLSLDLYLQPVLQLQSMFLAKQQSPARLLWSLSADTSIYSQCTPNLSYAVYITGRYRTIQCSPKPSLTAGLVRCGVVVGRNVRKDEGLLNCLDTAFKKYINQNLFILLWVQ